MEHIFSPAQHSPQNILAAACNFDCVWAGGIDVCVITVLIM